MPRISRRGMVSTLAAMSSMTVAGCAFLGDTAGLQGEDDEDGDDEDHGPSEPSDLFGDDFSPTNEDVISVAEAYFTARGDDDYETMGDLLHPDGEITPDTLEDVHDDIENPEFEIVHEKERSSMRVNVAGAFPTNGSFARTLVDIRLEGPSEPESDWYIWNITDYITGNVFPNVQIFFEEHSETNDITIVHEGGDALEYPYADQLKITGETPDGEDPATVLDDDTDGWHDAVTREYDDTPGVVTTAGEIPAGDEIWNSAHSPLADQLETGTRIQFMGRPADTEPWGTFAAFDM